MRHLAAIFLLAGASGCGYQLTKAASTPIDAFGTPPEGMGQICVLRPAQHGGDLVFAIRDNGQLMGATRGSSFFCYYAEPGMHRIASEGETIEETSIRVNLGQRYYLNQNVDNSYGNARSWLSWLEETDAKPACADCTYVVLTRAKGKDPLPGPRPTAHAGGGGGAAVPELKGPDAPQTKTADETKPPDDPQNVTDATGGGNAPVKKHHRKHHSSSSTTSTTSGNPESL